MRPRTTRTARTVMSILGVLIATLTAATAAPAAQAVSADPLARLEDRLVISERPTTSMPIRCADRSIDLRANDYLWYSYLDTAHNHLDARSERHIRLSAGRYYWRTCLMPFDGRYVVFTVLRNPQGGSVTQTAGVNMSYDGTIAAKYGSVLMPA